MVIEQGDGSRDLAGDHCMTVSVHSAYTGATSATS